MKLKLYLLILSAIAFQTVYAQDYSQPNQHDTTRILVKKTRIPVRSWGDGGAGFGIDYGGLVGARADFYPNPYMAVFGAVGWEIIGIGWNTGILARLLPADGTHGARPYFKVMYGVNAVSQVSGKSGYDAMYYGVTVGFGLETRFGRSRKNGINFDFNVPFRSPEYFDTLDRMKNDKSLTMKSTPLPITISIGYVVEF